MTVKQVYLIKFNYEHIYPYTHTYTYRVFAIKAIYHEICLYYVNECVDNWKYDIIPGDLFKFFWGGIVLMPIKKVYQSRLEFTI